MTRDVGGASRLYIRTLFEDGTLAGLSDGQLLERFATRHGDLGQVAFAALVERHGPMVLRACRAILRDEHEAMDAFQATFLVLVRTGRSLWVRDSLGPWLHRVACRSAGRARAQATRRRGLERGMAEMALRRADRDDRDDLTAVVHEELDRLPDRYRVPVVLCDLEGRTCEEAARSMGCPVGTIASRLARGREKLRGRLARRGLAPAVGALTAAFTADVQAACVTAKLAEFTSRLGSCARAIGTAADTSSAGRIAEDVLRRLLMTKFMSIGAVTAAVAGACLMLTWGLRPGVGAQVPPAEKKSAVQGDRVPEKDPFPFLNDPNRLKDAVYSEWGNMRPLIDDEKGVRYQGREAVLYKNGTAKLWSPQQKEPVAPSLRHERPIRELTFFNESSRLITTSDDSVKVWDALTGEFRKELDGQSIRPLWLSFAPAANRFVTIDAGRTAVTVWDAVRLEPVATLRPAGEDRFGEVGLSGDGKTVATFYFGGAPSVQLWDVASNLPFATLRMPSPAVAEIFAEAGTALNKSKIQRDARFWEVVRSLAPQAGGAGD